MVNYAECKALGLDVKKVESIARRIGKAAHEAQAIGLCVFGGSGTGSLRQLSYNDQAIVVAHIDGGIFDGGAGDCSDDHPDGLLRGE